jgi:hypothetical protein
MIRVILQGRTGNNLFQYAAGRALSLHHHTELLLDGSWADARHARQFEHLQRLPLRARYERRFTLAKRSLRKAFTITPAALHHRPVFHDSSPTPDPAFLELPDHCLLMGFFQSPFYFKTIEPQLRQELDFTGLILPKESLVFEENLGKQTTVSLHVRRGDYVDLGSTQCLAPDYYPRAIQHFRDRYSDLRFCVFSDDIAWCRSHFLGPDFLFCDLPASGTDPFHDLRLMAGCHHHIIVNSSYSWWGAWSNPSVQKVVVAPSMWMTNLPSTALLLPDWVTI